MRASTPRITEARPGSRRPGPPRLSGSLPLLLALCAFAASALSCVGVEARALLSEDGSGNLQATWKVPRFLSPLAAARGEGRFIPLPLDRAALDEILAANPGLELLSFERREEAEAVVVSCSLAFASLPAALGLFDPEGDDTLYTAFGAEKRLLVTLFKGRAGAAPESGAFSRAYLADYRVSLRLDLPTPPLTLSSGRIEGRSAIFERSLADILESEGPVTWDVTWR